MNQDTDILLSKERLEKLVTLVDCIDKQFFEEII